MTGIQNNDDPGTVYVDYGNVPALQDLLEANRVEIVISCLSLIDPSIGAAQLNLVQAANLSSYTKKFIASQWSIDIPQEYVSIDQWPTNFSQTSTDSTTALLSLIFRWIQWWHSGSRLWSTQ